MEEELTKILFNYSAETKRTSKEIFRLEFQLMLHMKIKGEKEPVGSLEFSNGRVSAFKELIEELEGEKK